jgi:hypothetical protein
VSVSGREIVLSPKLWRPIVDEAAYARNFEAVSNTPPRQYQTLTVFLNQMTDERRQGRAIAPNEYLEVFVSSPNEITVLLRRDHGPYWLLSREMFRGVGAPGVQTGTLGPLSETDQDLVARSLQNEIDTTRHMLGALVAH